MLHSTRQHLSNFARAALASTFSTLLAGCGIGAVDHSITPVATAFQGQVIGGETPITYSLVTFYETAATGVATATSTSGNGIYVPATPLTALGSTYTDYNGNFTFSTALACSTSSDFVYATAAGGNPGDSAINDNILLMAAVGPCSSFGASTSVIINELTTVAAAYALSSFTSVSGAYTHANGTVINGAFSASNSDGDTTFSAGANSLVSGQVVVFSACSVLGGSNPNGTHIVVSASPNLLTIPGTYGAVTGCKVTPTVVTTSPTVSVTSSATNYLGALSSGTYAPTATSLAGLAHAFANSNNLVSSVLGAANTSDPSNSAAILPASLINTLGNVLQGCVNSGGGTESSTATAGCPALFYNTSFATTGSSPTTVYPANTLQAILNIAHAPAQNVANIYSVEPATPAFSPTLASAPHDFSMAILYPQGTGGNNGTAACASPFAFPPPSSGSNGLCQPLLLTIDYADNIFVANSSQLPSANVVAFTAAGANLFATANSNALGQLYDIAADNLGNVFYTASSGGVLEIVGASTTSSSSPSSTTLGAVGQIPAGIVIDTANNLYVTPENYYSNNLYKYPFGSYSSAPKLIGNYGAAVTSVQPAIDASGNIWLAPKGNGSTSYTPGALLDAKDLSTNTSELIPSGTGIPTAYGTAIDSQGNAWFDSPSSIYEVTHTGAGTSLTAAASASALSSVGSQLYYANFDGNNNFLTVDKNNNTLVYVPTLSSTLAAQTFTPCIPGTATTCPSSSTGGIYSPEFVQADSTGSLWIANSYFLGGNLLQVIGLAAPAWPLSHQTPGVMP